jgi:MarR family transcriptional regulator, lower aerobic nicotinate degradation pathway regulator
MLLFCGASQVSKYGRRRLEAALADSLDLDKSHLVRPIDDLEERGLVSRTRDPSDRRRNAVALTAAGKALVEKLQPVARRSQQGFLDSLSAPERKTLVALLRSVLEANDSAR